jgi:hypothetical protein
MGRSDVQGLVPAVRRLILIVCFASTAHAAQIDISLVHDSEPERLAREQLARILNAYDVDRWLVTRTIAIDDEQWIPHSHPVLTLNARYLADDPAQLATLLHEQFHWWVNEREGPTAAAIAEFQATFPDVPTDERGARDVHSTYLHLVVCDLEYQAMTQLTGPEQAAAVLRGWRHYPWIYERVLTDPRVRIINTRHGLVLAEQAP